MKWLGYPIYRLLGAYLLGLVSCYCLDIEIKVILWFTVVLSLILTTSIFFSRRNLLFKAVYSSAVLLFCIGLAAFNLEIRNPIHQESHFSNYVTPENEQLITITLKEQLQPNAYNDRFYAEVSQIDGLTVQGKALVLFKRNDSVVYKLGDQLIVYDDVSKASDERNPGDFNYKEYLELIDVYGQIYVDQEHILSVSKLENNASWIENLRDRLMRALEQSGLKEKPLGIIQALILGQRSNVDPTITQSFRDAGVIHILALSGLHVGIILLILRRLTNWIKRFKYGYWIQSTVIILLLWIFALLTGMSPSIMRAVTMFSFIAIGMNVKRKTSIFHSLALSAFVLLLINPKLLFHVGFQLSYTAVIAIVLIQPIIYNIFKRPRWKVVDYFWQICTVTIAAQIGVAPLSLFYFHQFPGLFLLGNMLLLPVLPLIIGVSIALLVFLLIGIKSGWIVKALNITLDWIVQIVESISSFDQFIVKNVYLDKIELILIYLFLVGLALFFYRSVRKSRRERVIMKRPGYYLHIAIIAMISLVGFQSFKKLKPLENQYILMHQAAGSVISLSNNDEAKLLIDFHAMDSVRFQSSVERIKSSTIHRGKTIEIDSLQNKVRFNNQEIIIIDESGIAPIESKAAIILLSHSPQIHLDKVITSLEPQIIIVDGSNYRNYVERWKATCEKRGVQFLSTYDVGAINLSDLAVGIQN